MAGTIFGLPMSQRVDANGKPQVGWLLYAYAANSSTPVDTFQDTALSVKNPWPIPADSTGMMGQFWLADGSYRVRATTADGSTTFFDIPNVQSLGPSAGSAPSGSVDPNAIAQTGDVIWNPINGTRAGWVRCNGRTLGSATSGATERANADCQNLFEFVWNNFADSLCPVVGGRGASALADWTANKQITLLNGRNIVLGGLDDMGNTAAGGYAGVPVVSGNVTTAGSVVGESLHTTTANEMPAHNHTATFTGTPWAGAGSQLLFNSGNQGAIGSGGAYLGNVSATNTPQGTVAVANTGGGTAHNNVQKTMLGTYFQKL